MNCSEARQQISENVHAGRWPDAPLAGHLKSCEECDAQWESRQDLVRHLGAMRDLASGHRPSLERRAQLMRDFASRQARPAPKQPEYWKRAFAIAAALLLMAVAGTRSWDFWTSQRSAALAETETAADNEGQEGFIAVPYAPALASGELLRVVRTELYPDALISLGVDLDPSLTGRMPADLLVGEDGYPRAVRVSAEADNSFLTGAQE